MAKGAFANLDLLHANIKTLLEERVRVAKALTSLSYVEKVRDETRNIALELRKKTIEKNGKGQVPALVHELYLIFSPSSPTTFL